MVYKIIYAALKDHNCYFYTKILTIVIKVKITIELYYMAERLQPCILLLNMERLRKGVKTSWVWIKTAQFKKNVLQIKAILTNLHLLLVMGQVFSIGVD